MTGSIRDYTTNFKFIIPEFNIATWHDYIEQNFRSIDALFHNLFGINGFSGIWKTNSQYTAGQVLFVGEDGGSIYEGRLLKVVNDTNTGGFNTFSEAIEAHPKDYEFYADASSAQIFSELARDWANKTNGTIITPEGDDTGEYSAKKYAQDAQSSAIDAEHFRLLAETDKNIALEAAVSAETSAQNSETSAQNALISEQNSKTSETNAKTSEQNALVSEQNAKSSEDNAKVYETNAANSVETQTNNFNYYNNQLLSTTSTGVSELINTKSASIVELDNTLSNALNEIHDKTNVLDKTIITNCLTYVPQDINLELVDGTLTLKAGSKVYVPNGFEADGTTPKFDTITTQKDLSLSSANMSAGKKALIYCRPQDDVFGSMDNYASGSTVPTTTYTLWYDTNTNLVKKIEGTVGVSSYTCCFPLGVITAGDNKTIASLDQVFNGFGYIGSTVFCLPNIQGKTANGLNLDGTYKGTDFTTTNVVVRTFSSGDNGDKYFAIRGSDLSISYNDYAGSYPVYYDEKINQFVRPGHSSLTWNDVCVFGLCTMTNSVISNFRPKTTFQAVDRNDTSWLSELSMPSSKYIDLTLGANGSSYTAPANGWFILTKGAKAVGQYIELTLKPSNLRGKSVSVGTADNLTAYVPAKKGAIVEYWGSAAGTTSVFRFIYAEGEQ